MMTNRENWCHYDWQVNNLCHYFYCFIWPRDSERFVTTIWAEFGKVWKHKLELLQKTTGSCHQSVGRKTDSKSQTHRVWNTGMKALLGIEAEVLCATLWQGWVFWISDQNWLITDIVWSSDFQGLHFTLNPKLIITHIGVHKAWKWCI